MSNPLILWNGKPRSFVGDVACAVIAVLTVLGAAPLQAQPAPAKPAVAPPPAAPAPAAPAPAPAAPAPAAPAPVAPPPAAPAPAAPVAAPPAALAPAAAPPAAAPVYAPVPPPSTAPNYDQLAAEARKKAATPRETVKFGVSYSMGFPFGDLKDYVGEASFRGFDITVLWPVFKSLYVGPSLTYNLFYEEKARETYDLGSSAITGKLYRYTDYWSTAVVARYFFMQPGGLLRPYAGAKIGVAALLNTTLAADLSTQTNPVGFYLAPEVGVLLKFAKTASASISYQYNFSTASQTNFDNLSYGSLQFGVVLHWMD